MSAISAGSASYGQWYGAGSDSDKRPWQEAGKPRQTLRGENVRLVLPRRFVEELHGELVQPADDAVCVQVAELRAERLQRHDRFGHGAMAAGAPDLGEIAPGELAGILRVPQVPDRNHQRIVDDPGDDGPPDVLELEKEIGDVGDEVFPRQLSKVRAEDPIE